jgi:sigma-E factor negative regulatory protein RseB
MNKIYFGLLLILSSGLTTANETPQAKKWLEHLATSLQTLNFSTSFVVVKNNHAEPYHWYHGINDQGTEFEILALLNGPRKDTLRKGDVVSYLEAGAQPYSVVGKEISGPIPSVFRQGISTLEKSYDIISVGKSRILGRPAQLIRLVAKDGQRYGYWLWLDQESGLLLKTALITRKGQLLEQIQFTYLEITDELPASLVHLSQTDLPKVIVVPENRATKGFAWQVNWLPLGFEQIKMNSHHINLTKQPVEFMLFSDGLVDVSVYVSASNIRSRAVEFVKDGATVVLNQIENGKEISVVGKIPSKMAKAIADSVSFQGMPVK